MLLGEVLKLIEVGFKGYAVDLVVIRLGLAMGDDLHLDGAALQGFPQGTFDLGFEGLIGFRRFNADFEEAVVHGAQFNRDGQARALPTSIAEPRHAQEHSNPQQKRAQEWARASSTTIMMQTILVEPESAT